ncbi:fatty acid desaturase [Roseovarius salinarum]|uniref:fatty acid desaturase n=1 Tax=Roseovarius salinarum TaxID=1981892 RepID=UPI000C32FAD5|nr:fatty acid desaturase [Roseovarius salinarum]
MTTDTTGRHTPTTPEHPRDWVRVLARYRDPHHGRSLFELAVSVGPLLALWAAALAVLPVSGWLALGLSVVNALFLVRVFMIQHDCGHGAFFRPRAVNDWVGRALGVLTCTPYDVWRRKHAIHHATAGNLDARGTGDIPTLTVEEYRAMRWPMRLAYRLYRNPLVVFGLAPTYVFVFQNRLPFGVMRDGWRVWVSAMATNAALAVAVTGIVWLGGWAALWLVFVPTLLVAASIGIWLFYIQHQFEHTHWDRGEDWQLHESALHGASHYDLPAVLRWFTANIGIHHVHHLYARIPFYRLTEVLRDHPPLAEAQRVTLRESLHCARLHLWDEGRQRLLSFAEARHVAPAA